MAEYRSDRAEIKSWEMTEEGYLRFLSPISREGYLNYSDGKGGIRREFVSAKTLRDSAHSFVNKPVTIGHPSVPVTANNAKEYAVGWTGNAAKLDEKGVLWLSGTVFDSAAIDSIRSGKTREISAGYGVKIVDRGDGTYEQKTRVGNHIAAVARGRAGSEVAFKFDSDDELLVSEDAIEADDPPELPQTKASTRSRRKDKQMTTVKLDDVTIHLDGSVSTVDAERHVNSINAELKKLRSQSEKNSERADSDKSTIAELKQQLKDIEAEKKQLTTDLDATQIKLDAIQLDMDELGDRADGSDEATLNNDQIAEVISDRMKLWTEALPFLRSDSPDYEPNYSLEPIEIMSEVVKIANPELESHIDSLDLSDAEGSGFIKGLYASLNAKQFSQRKSGAQRVDSVLEDIRKQRGDMMMSGDPDFAKENALKKRSDRIRANGKKTMES